MSRAPRWSGQASPPDQIGTVVFGHVLNTEPRDMYLSRVAAMQAGIPDTVPRDECEPALRIRCAGGCLRRAIAAAGRCGLRAGRRGGRGDVPRALYPARRAVWQKMGDAQVVDMMLGALTCPFGTGIWASQRKMSLASTGFPAPTKMPSHLRVRPAPPKPSQRAISSPRSLRSRSQRAEDRWCLTPMSTRR